MHQWYIDQLNTNSKNEWSIFVQENSLKDKNETTTSDNDENDFLKKKKHSSYCDTVKKKKHTMKNYKYKNCF